MSSMKCLNLSDPIIAQAVSKYGETVVTKALDKYEASNFENLDEVVTEYLNSVQRANDITSYHNNSELLLNAESQGKEINPGKGLDADIKEFVTVPLENIGPALNSIQKAVKEIKSILPKEIEVEIIDDYKTVLAQGRLSVGVFKDGIVKLSSLASSSVAYHEAFHAVFRTMLSSKEQQTLLKEAGKRFLKPTKREIGFLMEQHKVSEKEATNLAYEEMLADEFAAYFNHHKTYDFTKEHGKPISNFFKRLLTWINKIFNNKITVEKLFNDITIGKYASKVPNITRTIAYNSSHPEYTAKEVQEFTKSLAYAIFKDVTELRDLHNLESHDIYDRAIDAILETRDYVLQAYEGEAQASLIYKLENLLDYTDFGITLDKFWRNQIDSYIKDVLKLKRTKTDERQEDDDSQDEQENTGQIKEHYKSSDKENASKAVKFMLAMVPQVKYIDGQLVNKRSPITGMYTFHDSTRINVQLKTLLSNVVPLKNEKGDHLDTFDIMLDKILEQSKYSPELLHLYNTLKNSSHITQTQFVVAMSLQRGNYINHEISGGKYNVKSNIITSEADSKSWAIFEQWAANFDKNLGKYENKKWVYDPAKIDSIVGNGGLFDLFDKALDAAYLSLKKDNFEEMLPENNADYRAVRNIVLSTFRVLGITLEPNTWNKLLDEYGKDFKEIQWDSSLEGLPKLRQELSYRLVALDNIFLDLKRALETLKDYKGEPLNKETNLMYDQKSFFRKVLADSEASFKPVQGEAMVRGPEGKIWVYQNHSYKSLILQAIKNNDVSHLVNMSKSLYHKHSEYLKKLLVVNTAEDGTKTYSINKEYADKLEIQFYGNNVFKGDGENTGTKAKDLKNPDKLHDVFTKYMNGIFIGLAEADKTQQNYFKIPEVIKSGYSYNGNHVLPVSSNAMKILSRYFYAELERIKAAYDFCYKDGAMRQKEVNEETNEKELPENFIPNYHFFEDKKGVLHPGSAFHSFLFPNANLRELGLIQEGQLVLPTSPSELLSNPKVQDYIRKAFIDATRKSTKALISNGLVEVKDNKLVNVALDKGLIPSGVSSEYALNTLIGDFTLNGIVANVEDTMLFNGDPAFYKVKPKFEEIKDSETGEVSYKLKKWSSQAIYSDFMKRIPAPTAAGLLPRLYNENGIAKVNPYFDSVCISNIDKKPSDFFGKDEAFEKVAELTNTSLSKVKESLSAYLDINQTDAQAWNTLDLHRERMLSYGKWTEGPNSHEYVYNIIKENEERVKQGKEEIPLSLDQLSLLAQPLKTVHYELSVHPNLNTLIPIYNKQSEAPLLPFMTRGTSLDNLRLAMEELGVGHVAVLDARKVGAFDVVTIVDENKNLLSKDEIVKRLDKSYYSLQSQHVMLQTDLNAHLVGPTKVGSQTTKNVLGAVEIDATYVEGTVKGREMALVLEDKISKLSDIGYIKFKKDIGYSSEQGGFTKTPEGTSSLVKELIRASKGKINQNHLDALNAGADIDSLPIATSIESTFANMNTKASVKLKQAGGAFIQLSNFGLVGKEVSLSNKIKNGIVWLKNPAEELLPMHTEDGKTVKAAQVLLPHNVLLSILNKQLGFNYKEMTHTQFQELISKGIIDKRVLEGLSYRIPNQAAGSNDAFEIVGFLPVEAGDTIVMYADVTVKTGSDFDIDKAYVILPEFYYDKEKKRIGYYTDESHKNLDKREKAIANSRLRLMREILMHPKAFLNVMAPLDNPSLADLCKRLFPEESMNNDLQFFSALQQLENKKTFDDAKTLVGLIADHMVSHNLYKAHDIRFNNYYLGIGNKDSKGNTALDKKETSQSKSNISMLLGLYMNAIVDAAKDPFISRANINLKTANIAFMLIRAGVELEWVTAFMGQPIIKEYLALQDIGESRFGSSDKLLEKLVTKYGYKDDVNKLYSSQWKGLPKDKNGDIKTDYAELESYITKKEPLTYPEMDTQINVLAQFLQWQVKAKEIRNLIKVSKVDVNGSGKSIRYAKMMRNLFLKLASDETFLGIDSLFGYTTDEDGDIVFTGNSYTKEDGTEVIYGSMIGTYYQNAIENFIDMFEGESLLHTSAFNQSLENIAARSGYPYLLPTEIHEQVSQKITNELRAAVLANTTFLRQSKKELQTLFYGDSSLEEGDMNSRKKSIFDRLREAQSTPLLKDNLFLSNLSIKTTRGNKIERIYLPSNETTREVADEFASEWELLWNTHPGLAKDLALYSFYSTGFTPSAGSFFKFIPFIKEEMLNHSKEITQIKLAANSNPYLFQKYEDAVIKNLYQDNKIVPTIKRSAIKDNDDNRIPVFRKEDGSLSRLKDLNSGFVLTSLENKAGYIAGMDEDGRPVYKKFIKVETTYQDNFGEEQSVFNLFELQGYTNNGLSAIYLKTNKLGLNIPGLKIKEYTFNEQGIEDTVSLFNLNNNTNKDSVNAIEKTKEFLGLTGSIFHTPIEEGKDFLISLYKEEVEAMSTPDIITQMKYCFNI